MGKIKVKDEVKITVVKKNQNVTEKESNKNS